MDDSDINGAYVDNTGVKYGCDEHGEEFICCIDDPCESCSNECCVFSPDFDY